MSEFLDILFVAFALQLSVLPGEKGQLIISGLSTRYHPLVVVSAAGAAFGGWTVLEILLGNSLKNALPEVYLTAFTAVLFVIFAVWMIRSAPDSGTTLTDGGVTATVDAPTSVYGREVPAVVGAWLSIFAMMATGEFGDKTQLITIGLAAEFGATSAIWFGEMFAIIPVSLANAYLFHRFAHRIDLRKLHYGSGALFGFFAIDSVLQIVANVSIFEQFVSSVGLALV